MGFSPHPRPDVHKHAKKARRQHLFVYLAYACGTFDVICGESALERERLASDREIVIADAIPKPETYLLTFFAFSQPN
jgi:hypothetical protein